MTCEKAVDWMQRSLDHDLDDSEREAMLAHISRCSECTEMYTRLQQLSLELARLPKVMPPISLVDAILPRLDEIDRLRSESAQGVTEGQTSAAHHASPAGWLGRLKRTFPLGAVGGVVAAGVMLALFITNQDGMTKQQADDATLMRQSQETASSMRSKASEAASQQDQLASKITSGSAGSQAAASGSASTTSPVAPMLQEPAGGPTPSSTPVPISGGSSQPLLIAPTPSSTFTPAEGKGESKGDGVSITGAPRPTGSAELYNTDPNTNATNAANASNASNASNSTNASNAANASSTTEGPVGGEIADKFEASSEPTIRTPDPNADTSGSISNKSAPGTTGSDSADDKSKSGPATVTPSPERPPMGLTALPPVLRLASPDGQYLAIYDTVSHRVTIKSSDEKTLVYASEQVWTELDAVRLNRWASATSVSYTVVQGESEKTFLIDIVKKQETAETDAK
ncbi:anti-sigma factor family protein [Paenibacillus sp. HJGM_3]|uniref:anti-sigma factor family protein n=1 Tax=Paenibacillus sp. HJGM_3 TaxID=3379816 RepID=UPI00385823CB